MGLCGELGEQAFSLRRRRAAYRLRMTRAYHRPEAQAENSQAPRSDFKSIAKSDLSTDKEVDSVLHRSTGDPAQKAPTLEMSEASTPGAGTGVVWRSGYRMSLGRIGNRFSIVPATDATVNAQ